MAEFADPCPAGGVQTSLPDGEHLCDRCERPTVVASGRWTDHSYGCICSTANSRTDPETFVCPVHDTRGEFYGHPLVSAARG